MAFTAAGNLIRHKVTAHKILPYKCNLCSESYAKKSVLVEHLAEFHEGEKIEIRSKKFPYRCSVCEVSFSKRDLLQSHKETAHSDTTIPNGAFYSKFVQLTFCT